MRDTTERDAILSLVNKARNLGTSDIRQIIHALRSTRPKRGRPRRATCVKRGHQLTDETARFEIRNGKMYRSGCKLCAAIDDKQRKCLRESA